MTAYLIEGASGIYWCGRGAEDFGDQIEEAVRFARMEDATRVMYWVLPQPYPRVCRVVEHHWSLETA